MVVPEVEIVISNSTGEVLRRTVRPGEYVIGSADTADLRVALPEIAGRHALRYFFGLKIEEAAEVPGISAPRAKRDWADARAWLFREMHTA